MLFIVFIPVKGFGAKGITNDPCLLINHAPASLREHSNASMTSQL